MKYWRQILRFFVTLQLLPALESGEETLVGGQAVVTLNYGTGSPQAVEIIAVPPAASGG